MKPYHEEYLYLAKLLSRWADLEGNTRVREFMDSIAAQIERDPEHKPTPKQVECLRRYDQQREKSRWAGLSYVGLADAVIDQFIRGH
jgi:hypothetical protein